MKTDSITKSYPYKVLVKDLPDIKMPEGREFEYLITRNEPLKTLVGHFKDLNLADSFAKRNSSILLGRANGDAG